MFRPRPRRPMPDEMARPRTLLLVPVLALVILVGVEAFAQSADSNAAAAARGQSLFGMNVPSLAALEGAESAISARAAIVGTFADWEHTPDFPRELADAINRRGAVPLISWEPWDSWAGGRDQPEYALGTIAAGGHDPLIDRWAAQVAAYGRPVMLRLAPEMNGDWLPWSTGVNGNRPGEYAVAWRHVRSRFRRAGADNAVWVWNPIAPYAGATPLKELFPGTRDVDWLALDGYNWGASRDWGWQTYADIFAAGIRELGRLAPRHPVMIAETGSAPDPRKAGWVTDTLRHARADGVDAVVWFEFAKENDWRLSETPATAAAARAALAAGEWRQGGDLDVIERSVGRSR
jgi:beta-mannanase